MTPTPDRTEPPPTAPLTAEQIAAIEEQRRARVAKNGRRPTLGTWRVRSRVTEMRVTLGRFERQCALMEQECDALDIAIDNGILITEPERVAQHARSIASHYRCQYETSQAENAALRDRLARAEGRVARYAEKCAEIEGEYHTTAWHPDQCVTVMFENRILEVGQMAIDDAPTDGAARDGDAAKGDSE